MHVIVFLGDPIQVLERLLEILYAKFGGHVNEKGFKVLDKHVRLIQGDGVNLKSIKDILDHIEKKGFSADNLVFGSGGKPFSSLVFSLNLRLFLGGLLQKFDRDTMKFAIKCSYVEIKGIGGLSVAKDPITDKGKRNKPGRLKLAKDTNGNYQTISSTADPDKYANTEDQLITVFENGKLLKEYSFETIRATCDLDLNRLDFMPAISTESSSSS
jgi:nicotinamide phosphoribosyltransferase